MNKKLFPRLEVTFDQVTFHESAIVEWISQHSLELEKEFGLRKRIIWSSDMLDFADSLAKHLERAKYIRVYSLEGFSTAHQKIEYIQANIDQASKKATITVGYTDACRQFGKGNTHVVKY